MVLMQETRSLQLTTPLDENELVLTAFSGREELSRIFRFDLTMLSDNNAIPASALVGKKVTFSIRQADDSLRCFNGIVSQFLAGEEDTVGRREYQAEVVPWIWCLTKSSNCRVFQDKSVPDIIKQVFEDRGFHDRQDFDLSRLKGEYPVREYCVQYRETDFNFVSRLIEEEGLFYFFEHTDGEHKLVLADSLLVYKNCKENEVDCPRDAGSEPVSDHLTSWKRRWRFRTGKWSHTDYNFETPSINLMAEEQSIVELRSGNQYEHYDYVGKHRTTDDGRRLARLRMEQEEVEYEVVHGSSTCRTFAVGGKFKVKQHGSETERGTSHVITAITHTAVEPNAYETGTVAERTYRNSFECIPDSVVYRPARTTPKPFIRGPHTAVVDGPPGTEIHVDHKYGRVKVRFHWDRDLNCDGNNSCWVRVAQLSAGNRWGTSFWPRVGQEVVVQFLEGDPDQPVIIGSLYNAEQMPPYLGQGPDKKHRSDEYLSGIKSCTSPGGKGFNEIRFDDRQGSEQVFIHAQGRMDTRVRGSHSHTVGSGHHLCVGGEMREKVNKDKHVIVEGRELRLSRDEKHVEVLGDEYRHHHRDLHSRVVGKEFHLTDHDKHSAGLGDEFRLTEKDRHDSVYGNLLTLVNKNHAERVTQERYLSADKVVVQADSEICLSVGGNFVKIDETGVTIVGAKVKVNCGGTPSFARGESLPRPSLPEMPGPLDTPEDPAGADTAVAGLVSSRQCAPDQV